MERNQKKIRLWIFLVICNILFIWGNSLLPGSISGAISKFVSYVVYQVILGRPGFGGGGHGLMRKVAHFTEFACLGVFLCRLMFWMRKPRIFALLGAFLVACSDETIQRLVPDRGPSLKDVLIDTSGAAVGMILLFVGYACFKRHKKTSNGGK